MSNHGYYDYNHGYYDTIVGVPLVKLAQYRLRTRPNRVIVLLWMGKGPAPAPIH
jgi:hypothetical protein